MTNTAKHINANCCLIKMLSLKSASQRIPCWTQRAI